MPAAIPVAAAVVGGAISASSQRQAASRAADAQMAAAEMQAASDAEARREARFRPVGTTNRFGTSNFQFDGDGRLTGGGYTLSPELLAQQSRLMGMAPGLLDQFEQARSATAPMGQAAQGMMSLGNRYLATDPREQAQKYMEDMQLALSAPRAREYAKVRENLNATGRVGLAVGGDAGMLAANPEMAAYYNSIAQQDRDLASQAVQGGMDFAKFGSGLVGSGGQMLTGMYGVQNAAYSPYATAMGGAGTLEEMGRSSFDAGMSMGKSSQTAYNPSTAMSTGMARAGAIMSNVKPMDWGGMLQGAASAYGQYQRPVQQQPSYGTPGMDSHFFGSGTGGD